MASAATSSKVGVRYDDDVRQLAFECWAWECDRSPRRVAVRLRELLPEGDPAPSHQRISQWAQGLGWDVRADEAIAALSPALRTRQMARLVALGNVALDTYSAVLDGELDDLPAAAIQSRVTVANRTLDLLGLGTAAGRGEPPRITVQPAAIDTSGLSPVELARLQSERLRDAGSR